MLTYLCTEWIFKNLVNQNILVPEQYGFKHGVSTDAANYKLIETVFNAWNKKEYMGGIICDLNKAFYCVNHELLLSNLKFYGVRGVILEWLKSYLNNRNKKLTWNL